MHEPTPFEALKEALTRAGSQSALARICGVSQAAVWKWIDGGKCLPPQHALTVERETGVSRHALRPDMYPAEVFAAEAATDECQAEPIPHDATTPVPPLHGRVVSDGAPIVACDRGAILHPENDNG